MTERDLQQHHEATGHFGICSRQEAMSKPLSTGSRRTVESWESWEGGPGFRYFYFHPYLGKIPNLTHIFQMG